MFSWAAGLFALNFYLCHELFSLEYSARIDSGEAAYLSISRCMIAHAGDLAWWPIWYNGIPGHNAYPPFLHALVALVAAIQRATPALAHHEVSAVFFSLGPIGLFLLAKRLGSSLAASVTASLIYSLISPTAFFVPWVRANLGSVWRPWRLTVLVEYGDAPHMAALAMIPFTILALDWALKKRRPEGYLIASVALAAIPLTNWIGAVALACCVISYLLATTHRRADLWRWFSSGLIAVSAYLLASPFIPPSTVTLIAKNGPMATGDYSGAIRSMPGQLLVIAVILAVSKIALEKRNVPARIQFAALLVLLPGSFPLLGQWARIAIVPQPHRYQTEMDLAVCLLAGLLLEASIRKTPRVIAISAASAALVAAALIVRIDRHFAADLIQRIDMKTTIEYQTADWLARNAPQGRVFSMGSISYWLNAFCDEAQVGGGFEPATPTNANAAAIKAIYLGDDSADKGAARTLLWLRAFGADFATVGGPNSREAFRPYRNPERFESIAQVAWRRGDDAVYKIARNQPSLAHLIPGNVVVRHAPRSASDTTELARYVEAIESPAGPAASFKWTTNHSAEIRAIGHPGDVISVQVTYDPGWRATANGVSQRIVKDGLGFLLIEPLSPGDCLVRLTYDGGTEARVTRFAALSVVAFFAGFAVVANRLRPARLSRGKAPA